MVIWSVIGAVDLRTDHGSDLDYHVVSCGCDGALFNVKGVFGYPGGDNGMEVGVWDLVSFGPTRNIGRRDLQPETKVVTVNFPQR